MTQALRCARLHDLFREATQLLMAEQTEEPHTNTLRALVHMEAIITMPIGGGCLCGCPVIDGHTGDCRVIEMCVGRAA